MIPTEPIGSLPRPPALIEALERGDSEDPRLDPLYEDAVRDTIERFEATDSPVKLGTTDDCGFSPFSDDTSTSRDTAFAKIRARVAGTRLAGELLGAL